MEQLINKLNDKNCMVYKLLCKVLECSENDIDNMFNLLDEHDVDFDDLDLKDISSINDITQQIHDLSNNK